MRDFDITVNFLLGFADEIVVVLFDLSKKADAEAAVERLRTFNPRLPVRYV